MASPSRNAGDMSNTGGTPLKRLAWFVGLWCVGVGAAALLVLPFRLLVQWAQVH